MKVDTNMVPIGTSCWLPAVVLRCWCCMFFLLCYYAQYISQFQRGSAMLFAARCRAALLVLHVFFIMLVCSVYFTIPTGQRDAVGCTLSCCASGFAYFFYLLYG